MCGRFCCAIDPDTVKTRLYKDHISTDKELEWVDQEKYHSKYNVCPTNNVLVMYADPDHKQRTILRSMVNEGQSTEKTLLTLFVFLLAMGLYSFLVSKYQYEQGLCLPRIYYKQC